MLVRAEGIGYNEGGFQEALKLRPSAEKLRHGRGAWDWPTLETNTAAKEEKQDEQRQDSFSGMQGRPLRF